MYRIPAEQLLHPRWVCRCTASQQSSCYILDGCAGVPHPSRAAVTSSIGVQVYRIPAEQLHVMDQPALVTALRNHIAFQLTYWFCRCSMIDKWVRISG